MTERSGGPRRHRGRLSRDRVLATALALVDREGLPALSMRRLAAELGVESMALYRYTPGKDALLDGLVEAFHRELQEALEEEPESEAQGPGTATTAGWRSDLHRTVRETYRVSLRHPQVVPLLATRMLAVPLSRLPPSVLRAQERMLALLAHADLDARRTQLLYRSVTAWVLGYVFVELRAVVDDPDEPEPAIRLGLHRMPAQEYPLLRATAPALASRSGERALADGLDALLDGFAAGER
ncbi:TetR/AcrR family transcriptional regulator [Streptomyces sp. NPDC055749]